jgi:Zn-dependent protease
LGLPAPKRRSWTQFPIRVNISWVVIAALVLMTQWHTFTAQYPLEPAVLIAVAAIATSAAFFLSVLLHELSHSLVAELRGIPVHDITLFVFGGVSRLGGKPKSPADEFLIAAVGPLTSVVLGAACLAGSRLASPASMTSGVLVWLGWVNVALAAFNLLPGLPLDGGRLLRAVLWGVTRNERTATALALAGGSAIAFGLMAGGVAIGVGLGRTWDGLWLGVLGWFLLNAVGTMRFQERLQEVLSKTLVGPAAHLDLPLLVPEETLKHVVERRVLPTGVTRFGVGAGGHVEGILTMREIKAVGAERRVVTTVRDAMVPLERLPAIEAWRTMVDALERMDREGVEEFAVMRDGVFVGMLTRDDIARVVAASLEVGG